MRFSDVKQKISDFILRDLKEFIKDFFGYIIAAVIVLFIVIYVVSLQFVVGSSMEPTYFNQDILLLNKVHYRFTLPKRFDIVAVEDKNSSPMIKRVIGLPGEVVEYINDRLHINGKEVEEPFEKGSVTSDFSLVNLELNIIPEGYYLVVGDNRSDSTDSRHKEIGLIPIDDFIGRVLFRVWKARR